jgi:hypothetical protein
MLSAVRAWVEAEFGGPTTEQEKTFVLAPGNVAQEVVPNNAERVSLTIVNIGTGNLNLALSSSLVATIGGIFLSSSGGEVNMHVRDDATLPGRQWWCSSGAGSTVYVLEVIRSIYTPPEEGGPTPHS